MRSRAGPSHDRTVSELFVFFFQRSLFGFLNLTVLAPAVQTVRLAFGHCWQGGAVLDGRSSRMCSPQRSQLADFSFFGCRKSDFAAQVF